MPSSDTLHARLFLLRATEPPAPAIHHYVTVHGPVDTVAHIRHGTAPSAVLAEIIRPDPQLDDDLRALDNGTARLLTPEDDDWPLGRLTRLTGLGAPLALWVRGDTALTELTAAGPVTADEERLFADDDEPVAVDVAFDLDGLPGR